MCGSLFQGERGVTRRENYRSNHKYIDWRAFKKKKKKKKQQQSQQIKPLPELRTEAADFLFYPVTTKRKRRRQGKRK